MFRVIHVGMGERTVLLRNGVPERALGPGSHTVFGFGLSELVFRTDSVAFDAAPEVLAVLSREWFGEAQIEANERGVLFREGIARAFFGPGIHRFWRVDDTVLVSVFRTDQPTPALTASLLSVIPASELCDVTIRPHQRGVQTVSGEFVTELGPGRHTFWSPPEARVEVVIVDMRTCQLALSQQELMTRDKVTLRLSLSVEFAVVDAVLSQTVVSSVRDSVHLMVQLAARDFVAGISLDDLLSGRDALSRFLMAEAAPKAEVFGVRIDRIGVKDVVLPGEMKTLLNRVLEAEKEAQANVILRREETAATRSLANTTRVLAENPILLRLRELDAPQGDGRAHRRSARRCRRRGALRPSTEGGL